MNCEERKGCVDTQRKLPNRGRRGKIEESKVCVDTQRKLLNRGRRGKIRI